MKNLGKNKLKNEILDIEIEKNKINLVNNFKEYMNESEYLNENQLVKNIYINEMNLFIDQYLNNNIKIIDTWLNNYTIEYPFNTNIKLN